MTENKHREVGVALLNVHGASVMLSQFKDRSSCIFPNRYGKFSAVHS